MRKKVVIVGAGPGGLTAAMILASHGYAVEVYEKQARVGGRNAALQFDGFTFDVGPTFLMMKFILEEVFELAGRKLEDYLDVRAIDPLYQLIFTDGARFLPTQDRARMREQLDTLFPGNYQGYLRFLEYEREKFARIAPCLQVPYMSLTDYASRRILRALPYLDAHKSVYKHLAGYFDDERLRICFTFQAKYLGMSPWTCPGIFSIIPFIEHSGGIHHPIGGLNQISEAMAKVVREHGGTIHLQTPVQQVLVSGGRATGLLLENGQAVPADHVVLNADFGHAVNHLLPRPALRRWTPEALERKSLSCSIFMLYLGVDTRYDLAHHNIFFAEDYRKNVTEITEDNVLSEDPSFYVQNACVTDPTLAPEGSSTLYVLVPVPNTRARVDWSSEAPRFREKLLGLLERRAGLAGLREHIVAERMVTPDDWERKVSVYRGATFNLAHGIDQMLYFRPHNEFEDVGGCYLVGGGTHPGSGLPTIYESGRISAGLILKRDAWYL